MSCVYPGRFLDNIYQEILSVILFLFSFQPHFERSDFLYTPVVTLSVHKAQVDTYRNPIPRIRRFIRFRGDAELIQFFADIEQSRNEAYCQSIYERYFGIPFKYNHDEPHWFIAAPILPLTADDEV